MSVGLVALIGSLVGIMQEENEVLRAGRRGELAELAAAKLRLTAELERSIAQLTRQGANWQAELPVEERSAFIQASADLQAVAAENAQLLRRQIELSRELMNAIAAEAKRVVGTRSEVYGSGGGLQRSDLPAPIAVNASL